MDNLQYLTHFIGRSAEIETFTQWLNDPYAPWILYIHDAAEEAEKKGGVGKTWLLRRWKELVEEARRDTIVVQADFFSISDRDRVFLAEKIISGLQELYPAWRPDAFTEAIQQYRREETLTAQDPAAADRSGIQIRESVSTALAEDFHRLDDYLAGEQRTLLVFFDTFEAIEQNPGVAVLRPSQTFPDNYQFEHMRVVIAGRNAIDWTHPNWSGREEEVQIMPIAPFSLQEMQEYVETETSYDLITQSEQTNLLYERTEGRPIIIGLVADVLNHRILTLNDLLSVSKDEFESYLVPQINKLENPLNWVILFMAHVYHRFNLSILEWILESVRFDEPIKLISQEELAAILPQLTFVRHGSSGEDFVLHDEMRRLVTRYCWERLDTDHRFRKGISESIIRNYEEVMKLPMSDQLRQGYVIETLYHRLFVDHNDGLSYFQQQFQNAIRLQKTAFARLLLQETQRFADQLSPMQLGNLRFSEARLLRGERNFVEALQILHRLEQEPDDRWRTEHAQDLLMEQGLCYRGQSWLPEAEDCFQRCLALTVEQDNKPGSTPEEIQDNELRKAHLLSNLGLIARRRGQFETALEYYKKSAELYKKLDHPLDYATALTNMSFVYRLQGKTEEALRKGKVGWRIRFDLFQEGKGSEALVGLSSNVLGTIYLSDGDITEAEHRFRVAFDIFLRTNYKQGIPGVYNRLGQVHLLRDELDDAWTWFEKAHQAAQDVDAEQYINSLNKLGNVLLQQHRWSEAVPFFEQAIAAAGQVSDYYQETESLVDLATALMRQGQLEQALQRLQEAEDIASRESYFKLRGQIEQIRGEISYHYRKNYPDAFMHFSLFCHYMALYNAKEYNIAVRRVIDALLGIPGEDVPAMVQQMLSYWQAQQLDKAYPELMDAFEEVEDLMVR